MTQIYPTIRTMTWDEAATYGLVSQGLILEHNCISYRISAETSDSLHIFKQGVTLFVLTINNTQDYIGFDAYVGQEEEPMDNIFLQGHTIAEFIGNNWRSLSLTQLASSMIQLFA